MTQRLKIQGSHILKKLIEENPAIVAGDGRTLGTQALMQVSMNIRREDFIKTKEIQKTYFPAGGVGYDIACFHHSWRCHWILHQHEEAL